MAKHQCDLPQTSSRASQKMLKKWSSFSIFEAHFSCITDDFKVHFEQGTGTVTSQSLSDYTAELLDLNPSPFGGAKLGKSCHFWPSFFTTAKASKPAGKNAQERLSEDSCRRNWMLLMFGDSRCSEDAYCSQHASAVCVVEYFLPMPERRPLNM